ncbi:GxGYxY motif-containing protein [Thermosporothrix hazakensis]|jgi:hypothetical protein|uniref:GxGYxY motif-containing protein n=2 Tax=Thermosporothrix TaxID=768650 RepID=A0A326U7E3_THEHA|nr:GxGYxYP domain-containing protein [Thermosporothrix hazakensis]PZW29378.1 GxGYxY motif-containing protein [Thermosporothrix hazakensis]BBH85663.1 hypothetical protein KTC_04140 [Thermosporothrix sp. COM3]GCE45908.1 hypothetical protein KTH_07770 [Thermosporothrix hazakensis]
MSHEWSRTLPCFQAPSRLTVYSLEGMSNDTQLSVASLVGLLNRDCPQIYLLVRPDDLFWLQSCFPDLPYDHSPLRGKAVLLELLRRARAQLTGLVIYDPFLPDSINIATMLAGQKDALLLSPALAARYQRELEGLPVLFDLRKFGWRSRVSAYLWAWEHLRAEAHGTLVAGLPPSIITFLRPYLIATRTFTYWLNPFRVLPDRTGYSEFRLMREILQTYRRKGLHLGWFVNEGFGVILSSRAELPVLPSDYFSNLEFWSSQPVAAFPAPLQAASAPLDPQKIYVSFTMSDGDNIQFLQGKMAQLWRDEARGQLPLGWTLSPLLGEAAPAMAAWYLRTASSQDELLAGPSGAGYIFPSFWPEERLPAFLNQTTAMMEALHLRTVQVLDANIFQHLPLAVRAVRTGAGLALIHAGRQQQYAEALAAHGMRGVLSGGGQRRPSWRLLEGLPICQNIGMAKDETHALALIQDAVAGNRQRPLFLNLYVQAWTMTPTDLKRLVERLERLDSTFAFVTPGTLLSLYRCSLETSR